MMPLPQIHFCRPKKTKDTKSAISVGEIDMIRLAEFAALNKEFAKDASPPNMWLVAAAINNWKKTVFSLDNSELKLISKHARKIIIDTCCFVMMLGITRFAGTY